MRKNHTISPRFGMAFRFKTDYISLIQNPNYTQVEKSWRTRRKGLEDASKGVLSVSFPHLNRRGEFECLIVRTSALIGNVGVRSSIIEHLDSIRQPKFTRRLLPKEINLDNLERAVQETADAYRKRFNIKV